MWYIATKSGKCFTANPTYVEGGATYEEFGTVSFTNAYSYYFASDWMLGVSVIGSIISSNWEITIIMIMVLRLIQHNWIEFERSLTNLILWKMGKSIWNSIRSLRSFRSHMEKSIEITVVLRTVWPVANHWLRNEGSYGIS